MLSMWVDYGARLDYMYNIEKVLQPTCVDTYVSVPRLEHEALE